MKRYISIILAISICLLTLVSCMSNNDHSNEKESDTLSDFTDTETQIDVESASKDIMFESESETETETNITTETETDIDTESATTAGVETESEIETETETETENITLNTETEFVSELETESETETETTSIHIDYDENDHCDICGRPLKNVETDTKAEDDTSNAEKETLPIDSVLFDKFYDSGYDTTATKHSDGGKMTEKTDTYKDSSSGYELKFVNYVNVYKNARDEKGNPALKLGKSSENGSFEFTVPAGFSKVVIKVAKYKDHDSKITINGTEYVLTRNSNDGEYDEFTVDVSKLKTVVVSTTEEYKVCMIRSIEFVK